MKWLSPYKTQKNRYAAYFKDTGYSNLTPSGSSTIQISNRRLPQFPAGIQYLQSNFLPGFSQGRLKELLGNWIRVGKVGLKIGIWLIEFLDLLLGEVMDFSVLFQHGNLVVIFIHVQTCDFFLLLSVRFILRWLLYILALVSVYLLYLLRLRGQIVYYFLEFRFFSVLNCRFITRILMVDVTTLLYESFAHFQMAFASSIEKWGLFG